ncbi:MAG: hypothetical protein ACOX46_10380 [Limnochordia bacterium]
MHVPDLRPKGVPGQPCLAASLGQLGLGKGGAETTLEHLLDKAAIGAQPVVKNPWRRGKKTRQGHIIQVVKRGAPS